MWFPYSLPTSWKAEGERERANDSLADDETREFLIGFQLRNPVSREWSVELQLAKGEWIVQPDLGGEAVRVGYFPDENDRLAEIACKLKDSDTRNAVRRGYALVSRILNYWSAEYGRGFSIGGLRIADLKHDARWRLVPHWPSAQAFNAPHLEDLPESFWPMASLYREGRTSTSDRYRFLCCETIIGAWGRGEPPFDAEPQTAAGNTSAKSGLRVTQELMVLSGMHNFSPELEGTPFEDLPERLKDWHRAAVSFVLEGRDECEMADPNRVFEWAALANLVDLSAHQILSRTIDRARHEAERAAQAELAGTTAST